MALSDSTWMNNFRSPPLDPCAEEHSKDSTTCTTNHGPQANWKLLKNSSEHDLTRFRLQNQPHCVGLATQEHTQELPQNTPTFQSHTVLYSLKSLKNREKKEVKRLRTLENSQRSSAQQITF